MNIFLWIFLVAMNFSELNGQECPEIVSATIPMEIPLGGKLPFNAVGEGGSGACKLSLEIKRNDISTEYALVHRFLVVRTQIRP